MLLNLLERDEEAFEWAKKSACHPSAGFWAFSGLAATHALLGQKDQAEGALSKLLEMNPNFSQAHLDQTYPGAMLRYKKGLSLAGLK
mgnify:FL=1